MREPLYFILTLHNHQPVGNFDYVFKEAFKKSYAPFLDVFEKTSKIKICLHTSGPLLDWLEKNEPNYLKRLASLAAEGRIEMLSGGYYEPILSMIREEDAVGQINLLNQFIKKKFKQTPGGFWLTERVWESSFPSIAKKAGLKYTTLDDTHFFYSGVSESEMDGFFVTENQGDILYVFPISKTMRYSVPFKTVHEVYEYLRNQHEQGKELINLADDGEKFGLWPGTYHSVYGEKWLQHFFQMLEDSSEWLQTTTYAEAVKKFKPKRRIYLPNASYEEMMEWSLDSSQQLRFKELQEKLKKAKLVEESKIFIRGSHFRNFFAKYSESAAMQNKQFYISEKISALRGGKTAKADLAKKELYKGECNCPYWHGIFGGLYLYHLRQAIYKHLIRSEKAVDGRTLKSFKPVQKEVDINLDGQDEWLWETSDASLIAAPHLGAQLIEWDDLKEEVNLLNVMTRRFEPYHDEIRQRGVTKAGAETGNIHELKRKITPEIVENLVFDRQERRSWVDRIFKSGNLKQFKKDDLKNSIVLTSDKYRSSKAKGKWIFEIGFSYGQGWYHLIKTLSLKKRTLNLTTSVELIEGKPDQFCIGSEWNVCLKCSDGESKKLDGEWLLKDEWSNLKMLLKSSLPFNAWQYTILTISQSETDYDLSPQGTCVMPYWNLNFSKNKKYEWTWEIKVTG